MGSDLNGHTEGSGAAIVERRGWWTRTTDELSAWLGNSGALSRRQRDTAVGDHSGEGPKSHADPDERIVEEIGQRLTRDVDLDASKIEVRSASGAVTLSGTVSTSEAKRRAEELSAPVAGVNQVTNALLVA
jgi:osmotically-inducible protein OsmY